MTAYDAILFALAIAVVSGFISGMTTAYMIWG
jgi:hypothetical protein